MSTLGAVQIGVMSVQGLTTAVTVVLICKLVWKKKNLWSILGGILSSGVIVFAFAATAGFLSSPC
ncbi:MAG TPA: hypothetical protein VIL71_14935 [Spirillospora sp.]